jgi:nitrogen fixation protein NifU and related proteins
MGMYSQKLLTRFFEPTHSGDVDSPDGVGVEGNATCGDVVHLALKVHDGLITQARFRTLGCATAIAASDAACELVIGSPITLAQTFAEPDLAAVLDGIPEDRITCASIALGALRAALEQARTRV